MSSLSHEKRVEEILKELVYTQQGILEALKVLTLVVTSSVCENLSDQATEVLEKQINNV